MATRSEERWLLFHPVQLGERLLPGPAGGWSVVGWGERVGFVFFFFPFNLLSQKELGKKLFVSFSNSEIQFAK